MHGSLPTIHLDSPAAPGAFENLSIRERPPHADTLCCDCKGHGAFNTDLNANGPMRHQFVECATCDGFGWIETDGEHHILDIIVVNGAPRWVLTACESNLAVRPKPMK